MRVVVNVHVARTTASEQSELGVITCSWRKLTTYESKRPQHPRSCCDEPIRVNNNFKTATAHAEDNIEEVVQHSSACTTTNVQAQPPAILNIDVTGNSRTTMSTQLQPKCIRDDDETIAQVNFITHTNRLHLRVQVQPFRPARKTTTMVEEG